ncbi:MAG: hypothetical protein HRT44_10245, partial [Bdellovibrionales bacterium]|nr:hypothetical protein [Bdellovibrionales bacterium]NQZ19620.1 hypothetical protein [Bdellovibrionales bacterium]
EAEKPVLEGQIAQLRPQVATALMAKESADAQHASAAQALEDHVEKMNNKGPALQELEDKNFELLDQLASQN